MREKCEEKLGAPVSCILYIEMFRKNQHKKTVRKLGMQMKSKIRDPVGAPVSCILLCKMFNKNQHKKTVRKKLNRRIREPAGGPVSANQPFPSSSAKYTHSIGFPLFLELHNAGLLGIMVSFKRSLKENFPSVPRQ